MTPMSRAQRCDQGRTPGNTLKQGVLGAGPWLALKAAVLVCALASQSCLVPQSVDPIPDSPHPPPRFGDVPPYLQPTILQLYRQGLQDQTHVPPCHCKLELAIPFIEEDDPTISLQARWFVDYDPTVPRLAAPVFTDPLNGSFDNPGTVRLLPAHDFDADALNIATNGIHVVDIVLAETAAFDPASTAQPNRAIKPGYSAAEHRFVINVKVDQDPSRPTCPDALPSVRLCE